MADHGFAFLSQNTFMKAPATSRHRRFAVAGVAWDGSVTNRPGARFGPDAIRRASHMLCDGTHPYFDCSPLDQLTDLGDLALPNTDLASMRAVLQAEVPEILAAHHCCWLGGDHSITLPLLRAYRQHAGQPLALLHLDAHCDTWADHFGEPSGHGTWTREAIAEGLVDPAATVQIGIRSAAEKYARDFVSDRGGLVLTARELRGRESAEQLRDVITNIRRHLDGTRPTYLTLDIDCLDPAFAPGTGTPEPGGLSTAQVLTLLESLADLPWIGMDCVEVSPPYDHAELTSNAAAHCVWTYLSGQAAKPLR
ncbi:MAG: agmatinase [Burkholderiales bacterium]|nr:agmatinase [Burkholderiales bacterium]